MPLFSSRIRASRSVRPHRTRAVWFVASPLVLLMAYQNGAVHLPDPPTGTAASETEASGPNPWLRPLSPKERERSALLPQEPSSRRDR